MARDNVEVEIKIPANKEIFEKTRKGLKRIAKFVGISRDIDKYFNAPHRNFLAKTPTEEFLRVRIRKDASFLTYKRGYWNKEGGHTHSDEYETKIGNHKEMEKILRVLNFKEILKIDKVREIYRLKNDFETSFDKVANLGYFIEIETLRNFGGREKAMDALYNFARKLGLDPTNRDSSGYVTLMIRKKKLFRR